MLSLTGAAPMYDSYVKVFVWEEPTEKLWEYNDSTRRLNSKMETSNYKVAGSVDRRNTRVQLKRWSLKSQGLSGSLIQA